MVAVHTSTPTRDPKHTQTTDHRPQTTDHRPNQTHTLPLTLISPTSTTKTTTKTKTSAASIESLKPTVSIASPMKARSREASAAISVKLRLPAIFALCSFSFLVGFFAFTLLYQGCDLDLRMRRSRLLESVGEGMEFDPLPHGESGEFSLTTIPFQVLSWKPRALYFPNFATPEQCQKIIEHAKLGLRPSTLALRKGETNEGTKGVRTSSGVFISASEDKSGTLALIEEKIAKATMIPRNHGEAFNVLRYEIGQKYDSHYDAFHPSEYGPQKSQRIASFLLYLSDVEEGGETMFPYENGLNMDGRYDYRKCVGLKVKPRQGDGLLFYSMFLNGTIDRLSLHGSCPVIKGEKWVATKWIRNEVEEY